MANPVLTAVLFGYYRKIAQTKETVVYNPPLVPDEFDVPKLVQTDRLRLRPLTIHDAVKDFDAVVTSEERLRTIFDPGGDWPSGLTLEQNIIELGWHQTEFQLRTSFAYTVVSHDETEGWAVYTFIHRLRMNTMPRQPYGCASRA